MNRGEGAAPTVGGAPRADLIHTNHVLLNLTV